MADPEGQSSGGGVVVGLPSEERWPIWASGLLCLGVLAGWAMLAWNYSLPITLHGDEISVLLNIVESDWGGLFSPLEARQVAPFGFLAGVKGGVQVFGLSTWSVRGVAFVAAVLSVPLFALLVRQLAAPFAGLVVFAGFVASSEWLLQACRTKPYTLDVLFSLLAIWVGCWLLGRCCGWREALVAAVVAGVGVWMSIAFYLTLGGVGLVLLASRLPASRRGDLPWLCLSAGVGVGSGLAHYLLVLRPQLVGGETGAFMDSYWSDAFLPLPWQNLQGWLLGVADGLGFSSGLGLPGLVLALVVLGAVGMHRSRDMRGLIYAAPIVLGGLASMAQRYPFGDRLVLYLTPCVLLLVAGGLSEIRLRVPGRAGLVLLLLGSVAILVRPASFRGVASFDDDVVPVVRHVNQELRPGQEVYLHWGAARQYGFYIDHMDAGLAFPEDQLTLGVRHLHDWTRYEDEIAAMRGHPEVWLIFSHVSRSRGVDETVYFQLLLDRYGERVAEYRGWGAFAILWRPDLDADAALDVQSPEPATDSTPE